MEKNTILNSDARGLQIYAIIQTVKNVPKKSMDLNALASLSPTLMNSMGKIKDKSFEILQFYS